LVVEDLVMSAKLFSPCSPAFLRAVMLALTQVLFVKRSVVLGGTATASGMYFIKSGIVKVG
jgi:hypothetical protein